MFSRSMRSFTFRAATILTAWPELWPSPCPGAIDRIGSRYATPGFWFDCGIPSTSDPSAMTGSPVPFDQRAVHALGMPATPNTMSKPCCSRIPVRYRWVSNSCIPNSPKLKSMSTISCTVFASASTIWSTSSLSDSRRESACADSAPGPNAKSADRAKSGRDVRLRMHDPSERNTVAKPGHGLGGQHASDGRRWQDGAASLAVGRAPLFPTRA